MKKIPIFFFLPLANTCHVLWKDQEASSFIVGYHKVKRKITMRPPILLDAMLVSAHSRVSECECVPPPSHPKPGI